MKVIIIKTFGNIMWFVFGGGILSLLWLFVGIICFITIIGIPVGIQCIKFSGFVLYPFGKTIEYSDSVGKYLLNFIWIALCGWEIAAISACVGIIWCLTIIGIPFGKQCFKFSQLAFMPFGAKIVYS